MVLTISSTSLVSKTIGIAFIFAKALNIAHLPSITGIAANAPISPNPRTAVPSLITATLLAFPVK